MIHESKIIEEYKKYYFTKVDSGCDATDSHWTAVHCVSKKYDLCEDYVDNVCMKYQVKQEHKQYCEICGDNLASHINKDDNEMLCLDCVNLEIREYCGRIDDYIEIKG